MLPTVSMYFCKTCGRSAEQQAWPQDDFNGMFCAGCGGTPEWTQDVTASYVSVAMYDTSRVYGGPEEGGWYYDAGDIMPETLRNYDVADWPQAKLYREMLKEQAESYSSRDQRFLVRTFYNRTAPTSFPDRKPTYC